MEDIRFNPATVRLEYNIWEKYFPIILVSTPQRFDWNGRSVIHVGDEITFQPRNGSIGIGKEEEEKEGEQVSTPQRFDWNLDGGSGAQILLGFNPATVRLE